ncbi:MAG: GatB/YqeY domain-containing protein, partial [Deferribacterota bacterium]|nr:GatB/YqeY domain-containing protein [Deferribacterota bacterium]
MGLKEQILNDMKTYMKNKDSVALGAIRMLNAEIKNAEIEKKRELKDEEIVNIISSAIKKRRESITFYQKGGRKDLLDKEEHEIK